MQPATDDYSAIAPIGESVTLRSGPRTISPLKVGQIPPFARALRGMNLGKLVASFETVEADPFEIVALVDEFGDGLIVAIATATGLTEAAVRDLELDELILIAGAVFRVNRDFFTLRLPQLLGKVQAMRAPSGGDGQTQSTRS